MNRMNGDIMVSKNEVPVKRYSALTKKTGKTRNTMRSRKGNESTA